MGSDSDSDSGHSARSGGSYKKDYKKKDKKKDKSSGDEKKQKKSKDKKEDKHKDKDDKHKDGKHKDDKHKDGKHKDDKHKGDEHKDDKHKDDKHKPQSQLPTQLTHALSGTPLGGLAQEFLSGGGSGHGHGGLFREGAPGGQSVPSGPPTIPANPATGPDTGASGQRIPTSTTEPFPAQAAGPAPPFVDSAGQPVYVGSALVDGSNVQPCRVTPSGVFIAVNGTEIAHNGRYDLLPLTDAMEWVPTSGGAPPVGKRLVEGGIENGSLLHHAAARVNNVWYPGKAGPALGGAQIPANGTANFVTRDYYTLVWRA